MCAGHFAEFDMKGQRCFFFLPSDTGATAKVTKTQCWLRDNSLQPLHIKTENLFLRSFSWTSSFPFPQSRGPFACPSPCQKEFGTHNFHQSRSAENSRPNLIKPQPKFLFQKDTTVPQMKRRPAVLVHSTYWTAPRCECETGFDVKRKKGTAHRIA